MKDMRKYACPQCPASERILTSYRGLCRSCTTYSDDNEVVDPVHRVKCDDSEILSRRSHVRSVDRDADTDSQRNCQRNSVPRLPRKLKSPSLQKHLPEAKKNDEERMGLDA